MLNLIKFIEKNVESKGFSKVGNRNRNNRLNEKKIADFRWWNFERKKLVSKQQIKSKTVSKKVQVLQADLNSNFGTKLKSLNQK